MKHDYLINYLEFKIRGYGFSLMCLSRFINDTIRTKWHFDVLASVKL